MRQICEIRKLTGGRYQVVLADGSFFPLYAKELTLYGIKEASELSDQQYETILQEVLIKRVRLKAMHLLETQDRTEFQLRTKLSALAYPEELIEDAVSYVRKFHYLDDLRFAVHYIETRSSQKSMRQLEQELQQKGVARELLQLAKEQAEFPDEEQQVYTWLQKKRFDAKCADKKEIERMYRFLLGKGYSYSTIAHVLRKEDM